MTCLYTFHTFFVHSKDHLGRPHMKTITFNIGDKTDGPTILNKIEAIKEFRDATNCSLRDAKNAIDNFGDVLKKAAPNFFTVKTQINSLLDDLNPASPEDIQFLKDILSFVKTTNPKNLTAHGIKPPTMGTFSEDGSYKVPTTGVYHNCGDECRHQCEHAGCDRMIQFHDEPYCFTHSPDEGSSVPGYDSRKNNPFW